MRPSLALMANPLSPVMHGASPLSEHVTPFASILPAQQSFESRPGPRFEQPRPPQVPQAATQQIPSVSTPINPLVHVGAGVGAEVGGGEGAGEASMGPGVGAGVGSAVASMANEKKFQAICKIRKINGSPDIYKGNDSAYIVTIIPYNSKYIVIPQKEPG